MQPIICFQNLTALHLAAGEGDNTKVLQLIEDGVDVEETDHATWTAIFHAVEKGHPDTLRLLLDKGANPNARTGIVSTRDASCPVMTILFTRFLQDATPLMLAAFFNTEAHRNVSKVLLGHPQINVDAQEAHVSRLSKKYGNGTTMVFSDIFVGLDSVDARCKVQ